MSRSHKIYSNLDNNCTVDDDNVVGNITYSILSPYDRQNNPNIDKEEMNFTFSMLSGSENYEYEIYIGWDNPIENGKIVDGIIFDTVLPDALLFDFTKLVSSFQGDDPRISQPHLPENPLFYVIVRVKQLNI